MPDQHEYRDGKFYFKGKEVGVFKLRGKDAWIIRQVAQFYLFPEWERVDRPQPQQGLFG